MQWDLFEEEEPAHYDVAQVCLNGHMINDACKHSPETCEDHCSRCGDPTIRACRFCNTPTRGRYFVPGVVDLSGPGTPSRFCHKCGKPYPWTSRKLEAAKAYALDLQALTPDERMQLTQSLDDLVKDTPMAQVAAGRFKRLAAKAGGEAPGFFKDILVDLVSETAKKVIWGP